MPIPKSKSRAIVWGPDMVTRRTEVEDELDEEFSIAKSVETIPVSQFTTLPVTWLFEPWIPFGRLSVVFGDPGVGKSLFALDLAARASTGAPMPLSTEPSRLVSVLLLSAEDNIRDTIKPRLEAAGADCNRVKVVRQDAEELITDPIVLLNTINNDRADFVIVDPITAFLGRSDPGRDGQMRRMLTLLAAAANAAGIAILIVHHAAKSGRGSAIARASGSLAITAAARSVMLIAKDPEDPSARILAHVKGNLAPPPPGLRYRVSTPDNGAAPRIEGEGQTKYTSADQVLQPLSAVTLAERFIRETLKPGPMASPQLYGLAMAHGISHNVFQRARQNVALCCRIGGAGKDGSWQTRLIDQPA